MSFDIIILLFITYNPYIQLEQQRLHPKFIFEQKKSKTVKI